MPGAAGAVAPRALAPALTFAILAASLAVSLYGGLELRGLFADGAFYLMRLLSGEHFASWEPARRVTNMLQQLPILLAIRLDLVDLRAAGQVYSASLQLLPLVLTGLSYFCLPAGRRHLFVFPLLHYLAGTLAAAFYSQTEASAPAAYFWILLFLILFRGRRLGSAILLVPLALPFVTSHEVMVLLSPILAAAAFWRARRETPFASRLVFAILALWFAACTAAQLFYIVEPRDVGNRAKMLSATFEFLWIYDEGALNVPAALGLLAVLALGAIHVLERANGRSTWGARAVAAAFAFLAAVSVVATALDERFYAPPAQSVARNQPAFVSLVLAGALLWSLVRPSAGIATISRRGAAVIGLLAAATLAWHALAIRQWSGFVADYIALLRAKEGLVAWSDAVAAVSPASRLRFERSIYRSTALPFSIVLAPGGTVSTIIAARPGLLWYPFDPAQPAQIPRSRFFDVAPYLGALERQKQGRRD